MAARPIDAAEGYRLYRQQNGDVELDEINEYLRGLGLRAVSPRMYTHYERLDRYAYESYIPINRLDVAVAGDHAWSEDLRAQYSEIRKPVQAELMWGASVQEAKVESLGTATASVKTRPVMPAGVPVVLRLLATGIERTATVVRTDPASGLIHLAFDPYSSLPLAPEGARYRTNLRFVMADSAKNVPAVTDLMLNLDRLLTKLSAEEDGELARLASIKMQSPFEILLVGGPAVLLLLAFLKKVAAVRLIWYQGTKEKYEAEGIQLDNDAKRRAARLEADQAIASQAVRELNAGVDETELLDQVTTPELPVGQPESRERNRLVDLLRLALELPNEVAGESEDTGTDNEQDG